jgi:hypothetical protein
MDDGFHYEFNCDFFKNERKLFTAEKITKFGMLLVMQIYIYLKKKVMLDSLL